MKAEIKKFTCSLGEGEQVTLTNANGASVTLSSLGAGICSVKVPDANGEISEVCLGYNDPASWVADGPCAGKTPGRYANRIAKGHFTLDSKEYTLAINNGPNALHGGPTGFMNRLWHTQVEAKEGRVVFSRKSEDGEEGYPGNLHVTVTYTWDDDCRLTIRYEATTDAPTIVNLTNHAYWNLGGEDGHTVLDHELTLDCHRWTPTDDTLIPTGEIADVAGTPMDFTTAKTLGKDIKEDFTALKYGKGYDNCWLVDGWNGDGTLRHAARLHDPASGRTLNVLTTQPAAQVYTGNWLDGSPKGADGHELKDYEAVAIECQGVPDAPNKPQFPSQRLNPGEVYLQEIVYQFS